MRCSGTLVNSFDHSLKYLVVALPVGAPRRDSVNSFDHSLKYLVGQQPADFIAFGLGEVAVEVLGPLSTALPARDRDVDGVFLVSLEGEVLVAHLEYHRRHQSIDELAVDVAEAQVRLFRREGRPFCRRSGTCTAAVGGRCWRIASWSTGAPLAGLRARARTAG
jgi:hypothetical protein